MGFAYCWLRNLPLSEKELRLCLDKEMRNKYYVLGKIIAIGRDFTVIELYSQNKGPVLLDRCSSCAAGCYEFLQEQEISVFI